MQRCILPLPDNGFVILINSVFRKKWQGPIWDVPPPPPHLFYYRVYILFLFFLHVSRFYPAPSTSPQNMPVFYSSHLVNDFLYQPPCKESLYVYMFCPPLLSFHSKWMVFTHRNREGSHPVITPTLLHFIDEGKVVCVWESETDRDIKGWTDRQTDRGVDG